MRINYIGNTCNNHYAIAKILRKFGIDAHLFLSPDQRHFQTLPESDDPELKNKYPKWIHRMKIPFWRFRNRTTINKHTLSDLLSCDLIHAHGIYGPWIMDSDVPYVLHPYGGDFFIHPFFPRRYVGLFPDPRYYKYREKIREGYLRSRAIILGGINRLWLKAYEPLLKGKRIASGGLCVDPLKFRKIDYVPPTVQRLRERFELIFFQPTRQLWGSGPAQLRGSKGNDIFFRGLAKSIHDDGISAGCILVDKQNPSTEKSKNLIEELNISEHVVWINPMPRNRLINYYSSVDITVEGMVAGAYGSVVIESMACACPVMMYVFEEGYRLFQGEVPPVINVSNENEVQSAVSYFAGNKRQLTLLGEKSLNYTQKFHWPENVAQCYQSLYETILGYKENYKFISLEDLIKVTPASWHQ